VTNVGNRPTFGADSFAIETHLLNFHPIELTPESEVEICFLDRLRGEIKFPSVEALREQIARDVKKARRYFSSFAVRMRRTISSLGATMRTGKTSVGCSDFKFGFFSGVGLVVSH